ncbi:hypothetical protein HYU16_04750 [Candidatus Woesearchaeota archaeon]|nr:hypothetical protein [Candidatus Woesearchaeota archaeon]
MGEDDKPLLNLLNKLFVMFILLRLLLFLPQIYLQLSSGPSLSGIHLMRALSPVLWVIPLFLIIKNQKFGYILSILFSMVFLFYSAAGHYFSGYYGQLIFLGPVQIILGFLLLASSIILAFSSRTNSVNEFFSEVTNPFPSQGSPAMSSQEFSKRLDFYSQKAVQHGLDKKEVSLSLPAPEASGSESFSMLVLAFGIKLFPFFFWIIQMPFLFPLNMLHLLITGAFPVWISAAIALPFIHKIKNAAARKALYFVCWYLVLTPPMVIVALKFGPQFSI